MRAELIILIIFVLLNCNGKGTLYEKPPAYEVFVASVDSIEVDEYINISEPVKIGIRGRFYNDCSELARISVEPSDSPYNIELVVYGKHRLNATCNKKEVEYSGSITITGLFEGRYRIRINKDNNLVRFFSIVRGDLGDVLSTDIESSYDTGLNCVEKIARVESVDITTDGFNSEKDQKIPYGTPINLVVTGKIPDECHTFDGFRYQKTGFLLYVDVLVRYCKWICNNDKREFNETYVITGLVPGNYTLYVNGTNQINFEISQ